MHSSRMRTVRNSSRLLSGGVSTHTHTWEQAPPPPLEQAPTGSRYPLEQAPPPPEQTPLPGAGTSQEQTPCCKALLGYHL